MRTDQFQKILVDLNGSTSDIEASALISVDGLMMSSAMPQGMDEDRVGAMSAALLSMGERTARELARGKLDRVHVQGEEFIQSVNVAGDGMTVCGDSVSF